MRAWRIMVAAVDASRRDAERIAEHVEAQLADRHPLVMTVDVVSSIDDETVKRFDAIVLVIDGDDVARSVNHLALELEEHGLATMAIVAPDVCEVLQRKLPDILVEASTGDADVAFARLEGMLRRRDEIRRLRQEITIARRSHTGISGQMTKVHEELQLAASIQREFLPESLPSIGGVTVGAFWSPAHYVSGDIYAVEKVSEDSIGVFLADCTGHGVPAALMTMIVTRSLSLHQVEDGSVRSPSEVLEMLNDDMVQRDGSSGRFATAVYAVINTRTREFTLASAGHPPTMLYTPGKEPQSLSPDGGLLGIFCGGEWAEVTGTLAPDSTLILYSDGFEQAFPDSAASEHERRLPTETYLEVFREISACDDATDVIMSLRERLNGEAGSLHQIDDLTMLCVRGGALENEAVVSRAA